MKITSEDKNYTYLLHNDTVTVYKNHITVAVFSDFELNRTINWKVGDHKGSFCVQKYDYIWKVSYEDNIVCYACDIIYREGSEYDDCKIKSMEKLYSWDEDIQSEIADEVMVKLT